MKHSGHIFFILSVGILAVAVGMVGAYLNTRPRAIASGETVAIHFPSYGPVDVFSSALAHAHNIATTPGIRGVIVNHHLLAANFIADTLARVDWQNVDRVILISPNHFLAGHGFTISSLENWQTPYGVMHVDRQTLQRLESDGLVQFDDAVLDHEHGIYNILPFLKKLDPTVQIVPLVIRDQMPQVKIDDLRRGLGRIMDDRTIVVGSFDFSHYQTSDVADSHDEVSINVLRQLDAEATAGLDVDSPPGVDLVLGVMNDLNAPTFTLVDHSNSAKIVGDPGLAETTSYVTGTFAPGHSVGYTTSALIHR